MPFLPMIMILTGALMTVGMIALALSGPNTQKVANRRLARLRERHAISVTGTMEAQMRRITGRATSKTDRAVMRLLPNVAALQKRLSMTGKDWTVGGYGIASAIVAGIVLLLFLVRDLPILLGLALSVLAGLGLPHLWVGRVIAQRLKRFNAKFPDAIELLVRGLRSGLPISETMQLVGSELDGPVGEEFRAVSDKMKIGRTMDAALQETADRLGTPEFQFFVITIAIQRETGGNLAETLQNLATVLRQRMQMKLKIRAMSSESKASAFIIGSLPFIVAGLIWTINGPYMQAFFIEPRLMIAGAGGMCWMAIGAFIMAKMISFEI